MEKDRECEKCIHFVVKGEKAQLKGCEKWECEFEAKEGEKNDIKH